MVRFMVDTTSFSRVTGQLNLKKKLAIEASKMAVHETAEVVFAQAQANVPRVTGALAASGKIVHQDTAQAAVSVIGYGDSSTNPRTGIPTADYAVTKHEDPRNGKWLENAILSNSERYYANLQNRIGQALL